MSKTTGWAVVIALVVVLGALIYWAESANTPPAQTAPQTGGTEAAVPSPIATATYTCDNGHTIEAAYYQGAAAPTPAPGQPPTPTGTVEVSLDGGPATMLAQTISADGARYSDGNPQIAQGQPGAESLVFWNKGNTALVMKGNSMDTDYTNCTAPANS